MSNYKTGDYIGPVEIDGEEYAKEDEVGAVRAGDYLSEGDCEKNGISPDMTVFFN